MKKFTVYRDGSYFVITGTYSLVEQGVLSIYKSGEIVAAFNYWDRYFVQDV